MTFYKLVRVIYDRRGCEGTLEKLLKGQLRKQPKTSAAAGI